VRCALSSAAAACLILTAACSSSAPAAGQIRIGVDLPLTGPEGRGAVQALNGIRFFARQHPALDGFQITLTPTDDAGGGTPSPQLGAANLQRFINDPALLAVIGPLDAAVARAQIPLANQAGLAMLSPATTSPCLTRNVYLPTLLVPTRVAISCKDAGLPSADELRPSRVNNFFRLATTDELQGPAAAEYAFKTLRVLRAAVISDHESYGQALADAFTARFEKLGGSVVGHLDLASQAGGDVLTFLKRMKSDRAGAIYFGGAAASQGCAIRAQMLGVFDPGEATPFLSGDGIAQDPACVDQAGANATGIYATVPAVDAATRATATQTIAAFKAAFTGRDDYGPLTVVGYDAAAVLFAAIDRAIRAAGGQFPVRGNVVSQLSATSGFAGVTGTIGFDSAGDTTNRIISIYEPAGSNPGDTWKLVDTVDYSATLPY